MTVSGVCSNTLDKSPLNQFFINTAIRRFLASSCYIRSVKRGALAIGKSLDMYIHSLPQANPTKAVLIPVEKVGYGKELNQYILT